MTFIKLHHRETGKETWVNLDLVEQVERAPALPQVHYPREAALPEGTQVYVGGLSIIVREPLKDVLASLQRVENRS